MSVFKTTEIYVSDLMIRIETDIKERTVSIESNSNAQFYLDREDIDEIIKALQDAKKLINK